MSPKAIDVIVPVYKSVSLTNRCLQSLAAHIHELAGYDTRLIVINDSPGEREVEKMLAEFADSRSYVRLLANEVNQGFVKTVNRGLEMAKKEDRDVILINADTETFAGTLSNLVKTAYSDPQIAFVSPRSNNASLCSLPHFHGGVLPTQSEAFERWKVLSRTMPAFHFVPTAVGFYLYIKHLVLSNFGFLDPEFGVGYEEENDLILRANKVGYRAVLANNAFAYHAGSASFGLTGMNLGVHQDNNLQKMTRRHPEFLPLVRRYESSPHFRAEVLLGHSLPSADGRLKIVFDLSSLGRDFNGTNELSVAVIERLCKRHGSSFDVNVICPEAAFSFHGLDKLPNLRRHEVDVSATERFAIAVRMGQPFNVHAVSTLEDLAAINIFGMLDTIADDCGYLSLTHRLDEIWGHVARYSNGLFFISKFSEQTFLSRFPQARNLVRYARLLPTKLDNYTEAGVDSIGGHVMIMGNHFAHKASEAAAQVLRGAFPTVEFVVLGKETRTVANVRGYKAGTLAQDQIDSLYTRATVVVLPSYVEGFGFGLAHALAAKKAVVARDIPATREILATYKAVSGVFLYRNDLELTTALGSAIAVGRSRLDDTGALGWEEWVDGFVEFCREILARDDIFARLAERIRNGDLLRKADSFEHARTRGHLAAHQGLGGYPIDGKSNEAKIKRNPARNIKELLALEGEEFVNAAYVTLFNRLPDADGMENYLAELDAGIDKLEILVRLRNSEEGKRENRPLAGFRRALIERRLLSSFGVRQSTH